MSPFRVDAAGGGGMGAPPKDWHMAVKDFVRQQMFSEMEPIRVQVALLQKQLQILDEKSTQVAMIPPRSNSRDQGMEKKANMIEEVNPEMENWMKDTTDKFGEVHNRVARAEGVLRELGALHDKFAQRHDSLVECVRDLDVRIDHVDNVVATKHTQVHVPSGPPTGPLPTLHEEELFKPGHSPLPPGFVPPPGGGQFSGAVPAPAGAPAGAVASVWTAQEHQAALEVEEFGFDVNRIPGVSLGIVLRNDGSKLVVDQIQEGCTMPVNQGDRIVGIDGIRCESKQLLELIRRTGKLKITCQRLLTTSL